MSVLLQASGLRLKVEREIEREIKSVEEGFYQKSFFIPVFVTILFSIPKLSLSI
jgi:hypothetical protein